MVFDAREETGIWEVEIRLASAGEPLSHHASTDTCEEADWTFLNFRLEKLSICASEFRDDDLGDIEASLSE